MSSRISIEENTLLYFHDPMCSWCWGYRNTLLKLKSHLPTNITFRYIAGGLAQDTDNQMPVEMQKRIESTWHQIQGTIEGVEFNYAFWKECKPRRSTYPACRAVIAADKYGKYEDMLLQIQKAYYVHARNPSDYEVLYDLSEKIGLNRNDFISEIHSQSVDKQLQEEIKFCRSVEVNSFPSMSLYANRNFYPIELDYNNYDITIDHIRSIIS